MKVEINDIIHVPTCMVELVKHCLDKDLASDAVTFVKNHLGLSPAFAIEATNAMELLEVTDEGTMRVRVSNCFEFTDAEIVVLSVMHSKGLRMEACNYIRASKAINASTADRLIDMILEM